MSQQCFFWYSLVELCSKILEINYSSLRQSGILIALEIRFAKVQLSSLNFESYGLNFDLQLVIESGMIMAIPYERGCFNTCSSVQNGV